MENGHLDEISILINQTARSPVCLSHAVAVKLMFELSETVAGITLPVGTMKTLIP